MKINLIPSNNLNKSVKKGYFNVVLGGNSNLNKRILEIRNVGLLLDPEPLENDFINHKNSGLNHVLVKLAKKNNIAIGFSLARLNKLNKLEKVNLLGKIMQNIMLCNKYKVNYYILGNNTNDINSLGLSLGIKKINIILI